MAQASHGLRHDRGSRPSANPGPAEPMAAMAKRLGLNRKAVAERHGRSDRPDEGLTQMRRHAADIPPSNDRARHGSVLEPRRHRAKLRGHVGDNREAPADHQRRWDRLRPISASRAEGCVDGFAHSRMGKRRRTRWFAQGQHHVAVVRAAVLDGRLEPTSYARLAA